MANFKVQIKSPEEVIYTYGNLVSENRAYGNLNKLYATFSFLVEKGQNGIVGVGYDVEEVYQRDVQFVYSSP